MFGYDYLIGDPTVRNGISRVCRFITKAVVYGFALFGFIVYMMMVCQISAW